MLRMSLWETEASESNIRSGSNSMIFTRYRFSQAYGASRSVGAEGSLSGIAHVGPISGAYSYSAFRWRLRGIWSSVGSDSAWFAPVVGLCVPLCGLIVRYGRAQVGCIDSIAAE